jgi:hypothetical protein
MMHLAQKVAFALAIGPFSVFRIPGELLPLERGDWDA